MANRVDITGQIFGELTAIRCVGVRRMGRDRKSREWLMGCRKVKDHTEVRTLASLRLTGDHTSCKCCRRNGAT